MARKKQPKLHPNPTFDKAKLPSRHATVGPERAPHRSYLYAMGLTKSRSPSRSSAWRPAGTRPRPATSRSAARPRRSRTASNGGGGTPREFTTITVTDGIAMGHEGMKSSLVSREVIADSVELTMRGHCYDALVGAGRLRQVAARHDDGDAAAQRAVGVHVWRLDPAGQVPRQGRHRGRCVRRRRHACRRQDVRCRPARARMRRLSRRRAPAAASSPPTPWPASPRPSAWRCRLGRRAGALRDARRVRRGLGRGGDGAAASTNIRPRDICTREAFENAAVVVAATGGSTNAGLHLPAMAHECGIEFDLFDVAEIFQQDALYRRPEAGRQIRRQGYVRGRRRADGASRTLLDAGLLHGDCMTVTGKTMAENLEDVKFPDQPGRRLSGEELPSRRPAAWSASRATWRPTAPS